MSIRYDKQSFYLTDQSDSDFGDPLAGMSAVNVSYASSRQSVSVAGIGLATSVVDPRVRASINARRYVMADDPFIDIFGDPLKGQLGYQNLTFLSAIAFENAYLIDYTLEADLRQAPTVSANISAETLYPTNIFSIPNPGVFSVAAPGLVTVTLAGYDQEFLSSVNYRITSTREYVFPIGEHSSTQTFVPSFALEHIVTISMAVNHYVSQTMQNLLCSPITKTLTLAFSDATTCSVIKTYVIDGLIFDGETMDASVTDKLQTTVVFRKFTDVTGDTNII